MGFTEMMVKSGTWVLKAPVYNAALIVALLLGIAGIITLVRGLQQKE